MGLKKIIFTGLILVVISVFGCSDDNEKKNIVNNVEIEEVFADISALEADSLINAHKDDDDFVILDVRSESEFNAGHIEGAILMNFNSGTFEDDVDTLDKDKIYLVYCRSGSRSAQAVGIMQQLGFKRIYNLSEGIIGWQNEELPVVE